MFHISPALLFLRMYETLLYIQYIQKVSCMDWTSHTI